ncbi:hypothetical protein GCM10007159_42540 [Modicisalibacter luteus]|nr:hypothetical protein GCM10007159_42540 [Halomonas lutea]
MQLTIPKAAKLYRKHRSTIHRHIESGRITCGVRGDGTRVIELSELIRCYGEPASLPPELQQDATAQSEDVQQAMLQALRDMHAELMKLREEVAELKRLPAPEVSKAPEKPPEAASLPNNDPHGLRAIARALRGEGS